VFAGSFDRSNEIRFIENMIVRYIEWLAFHATLDQVTPRFYYDADILSMFARMSPEVFCVLAKTREVIESMGGKPDVRVSMIMQTIKR
jgi:hypothetical protein